MRQKLIEAYTFDYSPPPTPGYFNEAVNDIQAKMTKDGVMMTNISDISNTKNPNSTTNLNNVGVVSFKGGTMLSPSQVLSNKITTKTPSIIGSTIQASTFSPFPTGTNSMTPTKLASISLPQGVWLINFSMVLGLGGTSVDGPWPTFAGVGTSVPKSPFFFIDNPGTTSSDDILYLTTSAGNLFIPLNLQGSFVYNQKSKGKTPIYLFGCTGSGYNFSYIIVDPFFSATRLA